MILATEIAQPYTLWHLPLLICYTTYVSGAIKGQDDHNRRVLTEIYAVVFRTEQLTKQLRSTRKLLHCVPKYI